MTPEEWDEAQQREKQRRAALGEQLRAELFEILLEANDLEAEVGPAADGDSLIADHLTDDLIARLRAP